MNREIDSIVVHHSASNYRISLVDSIKAFDRHHKMKLHPKANGYGLHIAYHFVIACNWEYQKTRPLDEIGYHAWVWEVNKHSIAICFIGNFEKDILSKEQIETARNIIAELKTGNPKLTVVWHRDIKATACPWKNVDVWLLTEIEESPNFDKKIYRVLDLACTIFIWKVKDREILWHLKEIKKRLQK